MSDAAMDHGMVDRVLTRMQAKYTKLKEACTSTWLKHPVFVSWLRHKTQKSCARIQEHEKLGWHSRNQESFAWPLRV